MAEALGGTVDGSDGISDVGNVADWGGFRGGGGRDGWMTSWLCAEQGGISEAVVAVAAVIRRGGLGRGAGME